MLVAAAQCHAHFKATVADSYNWGSDNELGTKSYSRTRMTAVARQGGTGHDSPIWPISWRALHFAKLQGHKNIP